jgi:hypothetical protein
MICNHTLAREDPNNSPNEPCMLRNMSTQISFLDLPGEICNWIYRNALVWNHSITPKTLRKPKLAMNLLLVNKKVYDKARSILYSQNSFDFVTRPSLPRPSFHSPLLFLDKIGPENSKWIESLELQFPIIRLRGSEVELDNVSASILDKVQSSCPSLKRLTLDTVDTIFDGKKVFDCTLTAIKALMWKYST